MSSDDGRHPRPGFLAFLRTLGQERPTPENLRAAAKKGGHDLWTVNEVVAYNLRQARQAQGWSQEALAKVLTLHTGRPWSNATVSAAERSRESGRTRRFDASDLMAFAAVFKVPVTYFFLPPETDRELVVSYLPMDELHDHMVTVMAGDDDLPRPLRMGGELVKAIEPFAPSRRIDLVSRMKAAFARYGGRQWQPSSTRLPVRGLPVPPADLAVLLRRTADAVDESITGATQLAFDDEPLPQQKDRR